MPRTLEDIEADIGKESALWQAAGNRIDALRKELRELDTPAVTGEVEAEALKADVDKAIDDYAKPVVPKEPKDPMI